MTAGEVGAGPTEIIWCSRAGGGTKAHAIRANPEESTVTLCGRLGVRRSRWVLDSQGPRCWWCSRLFEKDGAA